MPERITQPTTPAAEDVAFEAARAHQHKIAALTRAFRRASRAESRIVHALPPRATEKQYARAWRAADRTNAAMRALQEAYGDR